MPTPSSFHIFSWFSINWTHLKINVKLVTNKWVNWALCWLKFLIDDIVENIKFSHGFDNVWRHDQSCSSFSVNVSEFVCLSRNGILKNIFWFHISVYTQVGEKTILHFWTHFCKSIYQCSVVIIYCLKRQASEVMTWSWKQKLVGVSRTCRISWKIMKIMKTKKSKHNS